MFTNGPVSAGCRISLGLVPEGVTVVVSVVVFVDLLNPLASALKRLSLMRLIA